MHSKIRLIWDGNSNSVFGLKILYESEILLNADYTNIRMGRKVTKKQYPECEKFGAFRNNDYLCQVIKEMHEMQASIADIPYIEGFKRHFSEATTAEVFYEIST